MTNVKFQDAHVVVRGTSRYNNDAYDTVSVFTTIITDEPLSEEYYVPSGNSLSNEAIAMIKKSGLEFRPYRESDLLAGTEDVVTEAKENRTEETEQDVARILLRSALVKCPLTLINQIGNSYVYELRYDYKIYRQSNGSYQFEIRLPFDGIALQNGSQVQLTVLTPKGATVNGVETKGLDENGNEIQEEITKLQNTNCMVTAFRYQLDPLFIINYTHNEPLYQG